jgi:hypothetical protein
MSSRPSLASLIDKFKHGETIPIDAVRQAQWWKSAASSGNPNSPPSQHSTASDRTDVTSSDHSVAALHTIPQLTSTSDDFASSLSSSIDIDALLASIPASRSPSTSPKRLHRSSRRSSDRALASSSLSISTILQRHRPASVASEGCVSDSVSDSVSNSVSVDFDDVEKILERAKKRLGMDVQQATMVESSRTDLSDDYSIPVDESSILQRVREILAERNVHVADSFLMMVKSESENANDPLTIDKNVAHGSQYEQLAVVFPSADQLHPSLTTTADSLHASPPIMPSIPVQHASCFMSTEGSTSSTHAKVLCPATVIETNAVVDQLIADIVSPLFCGMGIQQYRGMLSLHLQPIDDARDAPVIGTNAACEDIVDPVVRYLQNKIRLMEEELKALR